MAGKILLLVLFTCVLHATNAALVFINVAPLAAKLNSLPESTEKGTILNPGNRLECIDDETAYTGDITMQIGRRGEDLELSSTGYRSYVILKKVQDYENTDDQNERDVTIICTKGAVSKTISTNMVITDVNDNAPIFVREGGNVDSYYLEIDERDTIPNSEGRMIFDKITVTDADGVDNDDVVADCVDITTVPPNLGITCDQVFRVEAFLISDTSNPTEYNFKIFALREEYIDFQSFTLSILARNLPLDSTTNPFLNSTSQNVVILILEVQDEAPTIDQNTLRIEMFENLPSGALVNPNHYITAFDQDLRDPNPINFELFPSGLEQDGYNYFTIGKVLEPSLGERMYRVQLYVRDDIGPIDRESIIDNSKSLVVNIRAFETNPENRPDRNPMNTTASITIVVKDVNDEIPTFQSVSYNITVTELTGPQTTEITQLVQEDTIIVSDDDGVEFNSYNLTILPSQYSDYFSLDRSEGSGTTIFTLYVVNRVLDYELGNNFMTVVLRAWDIDNPGFSSTAQVSLTITDSNDFRPQFEQDAYNFTIVETKPEDVSLPVYVFVGRVLATDDDLGVFGEIANYTIRDQSNSFSIESNGNIYLIKPVDYEETTSFAFSVSAVDSDPTNPRTNTVQVTVEIGNIIDTPPFITGEYVTNVLETSTRLQPSITVQAENIEVTTQITYSLISVIPAMNNFNQYFSIDRISGEFTLIQPLNYRNTDAGLIRVKVRATATPQLYAETYINITVENQNNDPPVFVPFMTNNIYRTKVSELAKPGTVVIDLNTTDADEPNTKASEVVYEIRSGGNNNFKIDINSGIITVVSGANLDFNIQDRYTIVVKARDNGSPNLSASATVSVIVENKNDKTPVFKRLLYQFRVNASAATGTIIGEVNASDLDENPSILYGLNYTSTRIEKASQTIQEYVNVDTLISIEEISGIIRLIGILDRDIYDRIIINATAEDLAAEGDSPRQIASASVVINVIAIADPRIQFDAPWSFARPTIDVIYSENDQLTAGGIFKLQAFDPLTSASVAIFKKVKNTDPGDYFQIEGSEILLKKPLDYEILPSGFNNLKIVSVTVEAISSDLTRTSTATIKFQVNDVNDNEPEFTESEYVVTVRENARYPSIVATISVTDKDSSSYGLAQFSLEGDTDGNFFIKADASQTNQAFVLVAENATLDFETNPTFNLVVVATDNNGAQDGRISYINMRIDLEDVNDRAPIFRNTKYEFNVIATAANGDTVGSVLADDLDTGDGGKIKYRLESRDNALAYFAVELEQQSTVNVGNILQLGKIVVARSLEDFLSGARFTLTAVATDNGTPPLSSKTIVEITVTHGVVDPKPKWAKTNPIRVKIPENRPANFPVATIKAIPGNSYNSTATIIYSFVTAANPDGDFEKFNININTGEIRTAQPLDYELDKLYTADGTVIATYTLLILATDSTNSTLTNQYLLIVELLDEDDNDPTFMRCTDKTYNIPVYARVLEALPMGQFVYQVEACDDDEAPNNDVAYRAFAPTPGSPYSNLCPDQWSFSDSTFQLDELTGIITTGKPLDRENIPTYLLCVQAIKKSDRSKRGVADLTLAEELHDVLFVRVTVMDSNDNGPVFAETLIKKVILSYPSDDISTAEATDKDQAPNNEIRYIIEKIEFYKGQKKYRAPAAFTIDAKDGKIYAGQASYEDYVGGYFLITIKAQDRNGNKNLYDTQEQKVYVTQKVNRIRVVINRPADSAVAGDVTEMIGKLNNLQEGLFYEVDKISYHVVGSQENLLSEKTDVCILVVRDDTVLTARDATIFLEEQSSVQNILIEYGATEPGTCDPAKSVYPQGWKSYWWVLVAFAIFIFLCVLILIFIILSLYSGYKRYMDTRRTYLVPGN